MEVSGWRVALTLGQEFPLTPYVGGWACPAADLDSEAKGKNSRLRRE
jgi:hypothetical protein